MAKHRTRRSVSMSNRHYDALKAEADRRGVPMSQIVTEWVDALPKTEPAK